MIDYNDDDALDVYPEFNLFCVMSVFSFETILKIILKICKVLVAALKALGVNVDVDDDDDDD